jgi:hypothetical protein
MSQFVIANHWTAALGGGTMLVAHWMFLLAAALELTLTKTRVEKEIEEIEKIESIELMSSLEEGSEEGAMDKNTSFGRIERQI